MPDPTPVGKEAAATKPKPDPAPPTSPPATQHEKSDASKKLSAEEVDDLEKELELDLENVKIDDNIDTSVSTTRSAVPWQLSAFLRVQTDKSSGRYSRMSLLQRGGQGQETLRWCDILEAL